MEGFLLNKETILEMFCLNKGGIQLFRAQSILLKMLQADTFNQTKDLPRQALLGFGVCFPAAGSQEPPLLTPGISTKSKGSASGGSQGSGPSI